ncbi:MAG: phage terminase small subunit P27 family [Alistipes sp.]|nr:phage terminase small subunit P27 family [Alistipes sp.]
MKGRKKLPDSIKALRGTDQPCRMTDKPAVQGATVIKLPKVGLKGTAKKIFAVVATELMHNNLLDVYGVDMVVAYAREMALYHDMMSDIEKEGVTIEIETKNGTVMQINPKRKIAEGALAVAKSLAAEFGMTPSSRSRVSAIMHDNAPKDEFAEFEEIDE